MKKRSIPSVSIKCLSIIAKFVVLVLFCVPKVYAADGNSCVDMLSTADYADAGKRNEISLVEYIKTLLDENILSSAELEKFILDIKDGRRINPIKDPETSIQKMVAYDAIEGLLRHVTDFNFVTDLLERTQIQNSEIQTASEDVASEANSGVVGMILKGDYEGAHDYFASPESLSRPDLLKQSIEQFPAKAKKGFAMKVFATDTWVSRPDLLRLAIEVMPEKYLWNFVSHVFSSPNWVEYPELVRLVLEKLPSNSWSIVAKYLFSENTWVDHPDLLKLAMELAPEDELWPFARDAFNGSTWVGHPELVAYLIKLEPVFESELVYRYSNYKATSRFLEMSREELSAHIDALYAARRKVDVKLNP